jgi:Tol biopolymer transport system component
MGQVYRATDTRLKRDVALKLLPDAFAADPDRVARFQREAELLATLNHPNIAGIHGLEQTDGMRALVLELVEGPTLADRIAQGPIPLNEALAIAKQIADALETAHEHGIIHRDLKPANVKLRADGAVKVLDFGLAKAMEPATVAAAHLSLSPTITTPAMTEAGIILGTAAYMSPEQAAGKPVDKRSDLWAFGVVLYEMLTGRRLFDGETVSHVLASVLKDAPDWTALPATTPAPVRQLLRRCLEKDRRRRMESAADARLEIEDALDTPDAAAAPPTTPAPLLGVLRHVTLAWSVAALFVLMTLVFGFLYVRAAPPPTRVIHYALAPPEHSSVHSFAVSPDGRYLVMAAAVNSKRQLWLRALDALQAEAMPGTEDAVYPFWSPDGRYIGFFAQGTLKKIALRGGPVKTLCTASDGRGGSWSRGDVIVFAPSVSSPSQRVSAEGGSPVDLPQTKIGALGPRFPIFLPDGRHFLYLVMGASADKNGVYVSSLDGPEARRVLVHDSGVVFAPTGSGQAGHLLFVRDKFLMAQPFDATRLQTSGEAVPLAEGGFPDYAIGFAPVTVSANGVLVYAGSNHYESQIVWLDRAGKPLGSVGPVGADWEPSISLDEKVLAFRRTSIIGTTSDIWLRDLARETDTRVTSHASINLDPILSPNGDRIVFNSNRAGTFDLYQTAASGSGQDQVLVSTPNVKVPNQWSRDDRFIVYSELDPKTLYDIWVLPVGQGATGNPRPFAFQRTDYQELYGQLSPDSRWMAYTSEESGAREVYVRPFPGPEGGKQRISTAGGEQARWRGDGKELFYVAADGTLTAVAVNATQEPTPRFDAGAPRSLFPTAIGIGSGHVAFQYDVTADGQRFAVAQNAAPGDVPLVTVVNWQEELKQRVPTR